MRKILNTLLGLFLCCMSGATRLSEVKRINVFVINIWQFLKLHIAIDNYLSSTYLTQSLQSDIQIMLYLQNYYQINFVTYILLVYFVSKSLDERCKFDIKILKKKLLSDLYLMLSGFFRNSKKEILWWLLTFFNDSLPKKSAKINHTNLNRLQQNKKA